MAFSTDITTFWQEFAQTEAELSALPLRERMERANDILAKHVGDLALEMSAKPEDEVADLIVTAHGTLEHFPLLMELVAAAPSLKHHAVRAFRERTAQPGFGMGMNGFNLATSDVLVSCGAYDGSIALEIRFAREIPQDFIDNACHMVYIMLDHVLGEYDFAVKVGPVDFVDEAQDPDATWISLDQLPAVFDAFCDFPVGGGRWSVMTLQMNQGEGDAEGDEEQRDDVAADGENSEAAPDIALVSVNQSANAVAMRADLTHAFSLSLPAFDKPSLAMAREIQDQAATLLEQPQIGILACTIVRGGYREAVYYVGDVDLAERTLAPILARDEVDSEAVSVEFDPNWSRYFEFAVHGE
jgi:hypothetical protein